MQYQDQRCVLTCFCHICSSRNCIGKNFAWMEMRLLLASFVYNFNFESVPQSVEDAKDLRQFITYTIASNSYKVKVTKRH
jgi:benzoate 4-monooxygenase